MSINIRNIEVLDDQMIEVLKTKSPQQRLTMAFGMWSSARKLLANYIRCQYPDWDERQIHQEVVKRLSHGAIRFT